MRKCFAISVAGKHIGSIVAERIEKDDSDGYLLFRIGNETVAMMEAKNIEISTAESRAKGQKFTGFAEYQSNKI